MDSGRWILIWFLFGAVVTFGFAENAEQKCSNPTGVLPLEDTIEMPALGYEFYLGIPFDAVNNRMIPFKRVCDANDLRKLRVEEELSTPKMEFNVGQRFDTITDQMGPKGLNLPHNLKVSVATGLLGAYREGRWLYEDKPSRNEAQLSTLKRYEWYTESLKPFEKNQCLLHYHLLPLATGATHYVSKITYGYQQIITLKHRLNPTGELTRDQSRNVLGSISKVLALSPDVERFQLPDVFSIQNLTATVYASDLVDPKQFVSDLSGLLVYNRDHADPKDFMGRPRPVSITLQRLPNFSSYEIFAPTTSITSLVEDFRTTEADFKDALVQTQQFIPDFDIVPPGNTTFRQVAQNFSLNYQRFKEIYQGLVKENIRQISKDFKHIRTTKGTENVTDLLCTIDDLESAKRASPFSNYATQVWSEILHRELEAIYSVVSYMKPENSPGLTYSNVRCSRSLQEKDACHVGLFFNSEFLTEKEAFLNLQKAWLLALDQGVPLSQEAMSQYADEDDARREIFKDSHDILRSGKTLTDNAWEGLSSKIDHAEESLNKMKRLVSFCTDNIVFSPAKWDTVETKPLSMELGNGDTVELQRTPTLFKIKLSGHCSSDAKSYF